MERYTCMKDNRLYTAEISCSVFGGYVLRIAHAKYGTKDMQTEYMRRFEHLTNARLAMEDYFPSNEWEGV